MGKHNPANGGLEYGGGVQNAFACTRHTGIDQRIAIWLGYQIDVHGFEVRQHPGA
jgi:hypothetical protein